MNRTSITGLACLLAVALTACAGGGEPPAPSGSPASAPLEALKEPANSMSVSPPLSPAPVSAEALAAYRALLAGEPGALDRPPEGLELHQVTLPPAEELEYVLLDLDGDGGAELVVQMVEQPQQFNAVFHYGDGELSCWQYDIVEMSCRDYPLEDGAMVRAQSVFQPLHGVPLSARWGDGGVRLPGGTPGYAGGWHGGIHLSGGRRGGGSGHLCGGV